VYSYALFDTAFGRCAIAWGERGIVALQLPDKSDAQLRKKLQVRAVGATLAEPPAEVQRAIDDVHALLRGDAVDLRVHALDLEGLRAKAAYEAVRAIPLGSTKTVRALGTTRAVLTANPLSILVPTHRVLANDGRVHSDVMMRILSIEAAHHSEHSEGDGTFGFDVDAALAHLRRDKKLARLIDRVPFRMKLRGTPSVFVALFEAIVYQQLSGRAP
jgi:O6-methylguanine-DNA--protein-cysteine methyltransferase